MAPRRTEQQLAELDTASDEQRASVDRDGDRTEPAVCRRRRKHAGDQRLARALRSFTPILEDLARIESSGEIAQLNFELRVMQARLARRLHAFCQYTTPGSLTHRRISCTRSNTMCAALLVISNVTLADPPTDSLRSRTSTPSASSIAQADAEGTEAAKRESRRAPTDEEALALAALEGLMAQPPERALPIIKKVLAGSQSALVKQRALFVLSQIDDPEAQTLLVETTRSTDAALRAEAIRNIGIGGNPQSLEVLQEIYDTAMPQPKIRYCEAWLISGSKNEVYQAALDAKSEDEANAAIRMLGAMGASGGATEARRTQESRTRSRRGVCDLRRSRELTQNRRRQGELRTRSEAVRKIGIVGTDEARAALREIYTSATTPEIKDAALEGC